MAGVEFKVQILRKTISTFSSWLDGCGQLLSDLPSELEKSQQSELIDLALKYKDLVLQMRERCSYIEKMNNLCSEIAQDTDTQGDGVQVSELAQLATDVRDLNSRFTSTLLQAKQHYSELSSFLQSAGDGLSLSSGVSPNSRGNSPDRAGTLPAHLPPISPGSKRSSVRLRKISKRKRKRTKSLHIPKPEEPDSNTSCDIGTEILEPEESPKTLRKSRSVPTDLDELMKSNPTSRARNNSEGLPDKGESESINSNTATRRSSLPRHLDNGAGNRRPKSVVIESGDEGFVYLDSPKNSPVLKNSPLATSNQIAARGHVRADTVSVGGVSTNSEAETSNEIARIMSCDSDSGLEERRTRSLDELATPTKPQPQGTELAGRLEEITAQLSDLVHSIAESRQCALQSLALEMHLGEFKALLAILEVQDCELVRVRAVFSPVARRRLETMESLKTSCPEYSREQVAGHREEISKLSERVGMLRTHCSQSIEQTEEVLELVTQYETQFKQLKDFLLEHTSALESVKADKSCSEEVKWGRLSEQLTTVSESKSQLKTIHELSVHLLYLEPIFDGAQVKEDLRNLTERFQQLTLEIFTMLEDQAKLRMQTLLMDNSVVMSWSTSAGLSVSALAKRHKKSVAPKNKLLANKEALLSELTKHKATMERISDKLHPLLAVLNSDETPGLDDLIKQVEQNQKNLKQIETNLSSISISRSSDNLSSTLPPIPRSLTVSEGVRSTVSHEKSFSDISMEDQIKLLQQTPQPRPQVRDLDEPYAEIGGIREEILSKKVLGESLVPGPSRGGYSRGDLPSPLVEPDHNPSKQLDEAIDMLPMTHSSQPPTPAHSTPTHFQPERLHYVEVEVLKDKPGKTDQSKSSSVSSLDRLQGSHDDTYAEIDKKGKAIPQYAEISKFRKMGNDRKATSSPDISKKQFGVPKYAEIDIKNLPQNIDAYAEIEVREEPDEGVWSGGVAPAARSTKGGRRLSLHEELLEFIGEEWAELSLKKTTHQAALDEAALDQALRAIDSHDLRLLCQRFVRGVREIEAGVQGLVEQIATLKPPASPDLERVHSAIDQCQKVLDRLGKLHPRLEVCNAESMNLIASLSKHKSCGRVSQLIEVRLFEVSTLWYSVNLKASNHMTELRAQEGDINYLFRQLQRIGRVLSEAATLLEQRETITNVDDFLSSCKTMSGRLNELSDMKRQVSKDIKDTLSQTPQTSFTKELADQLKQVNAQWKSVAKDLNRIPALENILVQLSLANIADELVTMETRLEDLKVRSLRLEDAATNTSNCKAILERARLLNSSLGSSRIKLSSDQSDEGGESGDDHMIQEENLLLTKCESLLTQVEKLMIKAEDLSAQLVADSALLVEFYNELNDLTLWISDTLSMLSISAHAPVNTEIQLRGKHQAIFQQIVTRQPKLNSVQSTSEKLLQLPSNPAEKQVIELQVNDLCTLWDNLCKQIVPAGSLPQVMTPVTASGRQLNFEPPQEFEAIEEMVEWLEMIESRLQPAAITVGDVKQIRRALQDLQMITTEVRSRETDYHRFADNSGLPTSLTGETVPTDFNPELSASVRALLGVATPDGLYQIPPKFVKFYDETTLERRRRREAITEARDDSTTPVPEPESDEASTLSHSDGPGSANGVDARPNELNLGHRPLHELSQDFDISGSSLNSALFSPDVNDTVYQLFLLWRGVWTSLVAQKQRLEGTLEVWRNFEEKKEEFCNFLSDAEERGNFFKSLSECKDLTVVQSEISSQQKFLKETPHFAQKLSALNNMSHDLITRRHSNDDTSDLVDMMEDLNKRWALIEEYVSQHEATVVAIATRWAEFYREYQSFQQWVRNLDTDMSNLNPFVSDLTAVKVQLDKMKDIQSDLHSREGGMDSLRLLAYKLLQGAGGCHINSTGLHGKLDNLGRRVGHLETLSQERRTALESALTEKQDFLANLADALAWLSRAERHLAGQKPLGTDFDTVHSQYQAHESYWREVIEQQPKIRAVISAGSRLANEAHWTKGTGEDLRAQFVGVAPRWDRLWAESEEWGKLVGSVYPEMESFQGLCSDCGQKLSDCELISEKLEPISRKLPTLDKQMEALDIFESNLVSIGKQLEGIVLSQRRQVQLGVKVTSDLYQLVKRFHQRWNQLKQKVDHRRVAIARAQIQYDPANLSTTEMPRGWKRATTDNGSPYFINAARGGRTQWSHPDLTALLTVLAGQHSLPSYPGQAYPVALKLRELQQKTHIISLQTRACVEAFNSFSTEQAQKLANQKLSFYDMVVMAIDLFHSVEEGKGAESVARGNEFNINRAVEMTTCWIRDIFDVEHSGKVSALSMAVTVVCLSKGKQDDKYKALFELVSDGGSCVDQGQLSSLLECGILIGQSVSDHTFSGLHAVDACVRDCFKKYVGVGKLHLPQFLSWLQTEPAPLSWLPILHRLRASEKAVHEIKCSVCKSQPFTGFRYHCMQCAAFDMCQKCYWSGRSGKGHDRTKHFMEEYCIPRPAEEVKDFLKTIRKSFRLKKRSDTLPNMGQEVGGADHTHSRPPSTTSKRHSAYVPVSIRGGPRRGGGGSIHPGRRFTVLGDNVQSALRMDSRGTGRRSPPPSADRLKAPPSGRGLPPTAAPQGNGDLEDSLSRISQTSKSLSFRLRSLRERHASPGSPDHADGEREGGKSPTPDGELRRRNAMLQGRVQLLQEHNLRLENCISQLKLIANLQQSSRSRPLPSQPQAPPTVPSRGYRTPLDNGVFYDTPPTVPADYEVPPTNHHAELYSVPSGRGPGASAEVYSVPSGRGPGASAEVYDVPNRRSELYDVPSPHKTSSEDLYNVPTSKRASNSYSGNDLYSIPRQADGDSNNKAHDLYSVPSPRKAEGVFNMSPSSGELYDVPPVKTRGPSGVARATSGDLYDFPPNKTQSRAPAIKVSNGTSGRSQQPLIYDIPPPRLITSQPNPEIPPPKLPKRTYKTTTTDTPTRKSNSRL